MLLVPLDFRKEILKVSSAILISNYVRGHHPAHHTVTVSKNLASYREPYGVVTGGYQPYSTVTVWWEAQLGEVGGLSHGSGGKAGFVLRPHCSFPFLSPSAVQR